jgi:hypothetical protein
MAKQITGTYGAGGNWSKAGTAVTTTDTSGTAATLGAEAVAIGDNTVAVGDVSLSAIDRGRVSTVRGEATATASAEGGTTYTSATTYADVEGADFVITHTVNGTGDNSTTSTTKVLAFSIDNFDLPDGPLVHTSTQEKYLPGSQVGSIDGNLAQISASATAVGDASVTLTQTDTLTTDDFSYAAGDAWTLIG